MILLKCFLNCFKNLSQFFLGLSFLWFHFLANQSPINPKYVFDITVFLWFHDFFSCRKISGKTFRKNQVDGILSMQTCTKNTFPWFYQINSSQDRFADLMSAFYAQTVQTDKAGDMWIWRLQDKNTMSGYSPTGSVLFADYVESDCTNRLN